MLLENDHTDMLNVPSALIPLPIQFFLELRSARNLRCMHCYVRAGEGKTHQTQPASPHTLIRDFWEIGRVVTFSVRSTTKSK